LATVALALFVRDFVRGAFFAALVDFLLVVFVSLSASNKILWSSDVKL
jgi:hypothetical protein